MAYEEYWFLFALASAWMVFAVVQDLRKREIANWLNFSLVGVAIAYKMFYSLSINDFRIFGFSIAGFGIFVALAYGFYYGRIFAGGDAKLLMGVGAVLPFRNYWDLVFVGGGFLFLLFLAGAVYTLLYSGLIVINNRKKFVSGFRDEMRGKRLWFAILFLVGLLFVGQIPFLRWLGIIVCVELFMLLYIYVKAVDGCMVKQVGASELTEGDWLERDVKLSRGVIRKSVHGLSWGEIGRLRREGKRVTIKEGVPFVPAFLFAFLIMVYALAISGLQVESLLALFG